MAWIILIIAGLFEVAWAVCLKYSNGLTRLWPSLATAVTMAISLWLLGVAMKSIPLGTAYSVWVGVGAVGAVILGIFLFKEPLTLWRMASVAVIILGLIGLKLTSS